MKHLNTTIVVFGGIARQTNSLIRTHFQRGFATFGLALVAGLLALSVQAQEIQTYTKNYWAGVNSNPSTNYTVALGTNNVVAAGFTNVNFQIANQPPSGLTSITFNPTSITNTRGMSLSFKVSGPISLGTYPLTINALTNDGVSITNVIASTNVNLIVGQQWAQTNANSIGNWSDTTKWTGGAVPTSVDSVFISHATVGPWTNVVDSSQSISNLVYLGNADDNGIGLGVQTIIGAGVTLSVLGDKGLIFGQVSQSGVRPYYQFTGNSLVVSNPAAIFSANNANANTTRNLTVNMQNLTNFSATVSRVAIADCSALENGTVGSQRVGLTLAKTNFIRALFTDDYNALDFNNSIQFNRQREAGNNGGIATDYFGLGGVNVINADSIGVGRGGAAGSGSTAYSAFGYQMRFTTQNSTTPTNSAIFRNSDGVSRMSLVAVGVDSGNHSLAQNRGVIDLRGGTVDMLVDQIWIARNRTNSPVNDDLGGFYFDNGTVNANTIIAGYMKFSNAVTTVTGYLLAGTNGTLTVNSNILLGYTPADVTGFEASAAASSGQVRIDNGGVIRANQISVGALSTNNTITMNLGSKLIVSNTIASSSRMLGALTSAGGSLTFSVNGANALVFASNLTASASSPINIASVSGLVNFPFPITSTNIHLISYINATTPNNWAGGTGPSGIIVGVANNPGNSSIDVTLTAGAAKSLMWKDYTGDHSWNNSSKNWLDLNTLVHTNFSTLDSVTFDDSGFANVTVAEDVVPAQSGAGILVTNNSTAYTFTGSGKILGAAALVKAGTNSLTMDSYAESGVSLNNGTVVLTTSGTVGSVVSSTNGTFYNSGLVLGLVNSSGVITNAGTITTSLSLQKGARMTNSTAGVVNGSISMSGAVLLNLGLLDNSSITVNTNATLINANTINTTAGVTVNPLGTLIDVVPGSTGSGAGSINVGTTLTINGGGTFIPGGSALQTTKVAEYPANSDQPAGGVLLSTGSTNIFRVNLGNSQTSTLLLSKNQRYGPNHQNKVFDGCTLVITNVGATPFAAGQTLHLFENYQGTGTITPPSGVNITNTYPIIIPATPGPGLQWSVHDLYFLGNIKVIAANDPVYAVTVTNNVTVSPSNVISQLSWPDANTGGWLEQKTVALTNGLAGGSWTFIGSSVTNTVITITNTGVGEGATFFRYVNP